MEGASSRPGPHVDLFFFFLDDFFFPTTWTPAPFCFIERLFSSALIFRFFLLAIDPRAPLYSSPPFPLGRKRIFLRLDVAPRALHKFPRSPRRDSKIRLRGEFCDFFFFCCGSFFRCVLCTVFGFFFFFVFLSIPLFSPSLEKRFLVDAAVESGGILVE